MYLYCQLFTSCALKLKRQKTSKGLLDKTDPSYAIHAIAKIFREYIVHANSMTSEESYKHASSNLDKVNFFLSDVPIFARLISGEYFTDKANYWTAGLFISAAINKVIKENEIVTLGFPILGFPVDCIGYGLKRGKIALQENAGDYLGEGMSGGEITIQHNAGYYLGYNMSGGRIIVHGNTGDHIGTYMSGGIIDIKGQIGSIAGSCRGKIYHRGMLVR